MAQALLWALILQDKVMFPAPRHSFYLQLISLLALEQLVLKTDFYRHYKELLWNK